MVSKLTSQESFNLHLLIHKSSSLTFTPLSKPVIEPPPHLPSYLPPTEFHSASPTVY